LDLRTTHNFSVSNSTEFKKNLLIWAANFKEVSFLDSNSYEDSFGSFDTLVAIDSNASLATT